MSNDYKTLFLVIVELNGYKFIIIYLTVSLL